MSDFENAVLDGALYQLNFILVENYKGQLIDSWRYLGHTGVSKTLTRLKEVFDNKEDSHMRVSMCNYDTFGTLQINLLFAGNIKGEDLRSVLTEVKHFNLPENDILPEADSVSAVTRSVVPVCFRVEVPADTSAEEVLAFNESKIQMFSEIVKRKLENKLEESDVNLGVNLPTSWIVTNDPTKDRLINQYDPTTRCEFVMYGVLLRADPYNHRSLILEFIERVLNTNGDVK